MIIALLTFWYIYISWCYGQDLNYVFRNQQDDKNDSALLTTPFCTFVQVFRVVAAPAQLCNTYNVVS